MVNRNLMRQFEPSEADVRAELESAFGAQEDWLPADEQDFKDNKLVTGRILRIAGDVVWVDIGFKSEGILPLADFQSAGETVKPGDKIPVSVKGRDPEGYYLLTRFRTELPKDWSALERAYAERSMWLVWFHVTPTFDSVRRDPRFDSIVRRMGLPPEAGLPPS